MWGRIKWLLRQTGLSTGRILDPAFDGYRAEVQRAAHLPEGQKRIHMFGADFDSIHAGNAFCFGDGGRNSPEPITQELDGAMINTIHVTILRDDLEGKLGKLLPAATSEKVIKAASGRNTVIIIEEEAFGDLPFMLHDTKTLTYLGAETVTG